jgi:tRNA modification GTPase
LEFSTTDTIVAIATPPGRGGIGIVRISGPGAFRIAASLTGRDQPFEPRYATLATVNCAGAAADRVLVTAFPAPHSYTTEDVVEISGHGSPVLLEGIVREAMRAGARLAQPGEFTFRAFLNGRVDLVQAEAVRDLVEAVTPLQARAAFDQLEGTLTRDIAAIDGALFDLCARLEASLDFPGEGYHFVSQDGAAAAIAAIRDQVDALLRDAERGRLIRDGLQVVLAGRPNTGKSSLFNRLAGSGRAIVTEIPGTTRDLITETIEVAGMPVTIVDTAGVREAPGDPIEAEGIARAASARGVAALVVVVLDGSTPLTSDDRALLDQTANTPRVLVINKSDLPPAWPPESMPLETLRVSALTGEGVDALSTAIAAAMHVRTPERDVPAVTNLRHAALLVEARGSLAAAAAAAAAGVPEEFVLADLHEARERLEQVTGARTTDDMLARIFSSFCIGK